MRTNAQLADFHGVDERTIRRWKTGGACLDDDEAMQLWKAVNGRTRRHSMDRGELKPAVSTTDDARHGEARFYESEIEAIVKAFLALRETYPDAAAALTKVAQDAAGWLLVIE